jgi:hypothetical protein
VNLETKEKKEAMAKLAPMDPQVTTEIKVVMVIQVPKGRSVRQDPKANLVTRETTVCQDLLEKEVPMEKPGQEETLVQEVTKAPEANMEDLDQMAPLARMAPMERLETMVIRDRPVKPVLKERTVQPATREKLSLVLVAIKVILDQLGTKDPLEKPDQRVIEDLMVPQVQEEVMARLVRGDPRESLDHTEKKEKKENLVTRGLMVSLAAMARPERPVAMDTMAAQDLRVNTVTEAEKAPKAIKVPKVTLVNVEIKVPLVNMVPLVLQATLDPKVSMEVKDLLVKQVLKVSLVKMVTKVPRA